MKDKSIEEIKARYTLSCDGWIPVEADDWSHLVNSYDILLDINKMKDEKITHLAKMLDKVLDLVPSDDCNGDCYESVLLCDSVLGVKRNAK